MCVSVCEMRYTLANTLFATERESSVVQSFAKRTRKSSTFPKRPPPLRSAQVSSSGELINRFFSHRRAVWLTSATTILPRCLRRFNQPAIGFTAAERSIAFAGGVGWARNLLVDFPEDGCAIISASRSGLSSAVHAQGRRRTIGGHRSG